MSVLQSYQTVTDVIL